MKKNTMEDNLQTTPVDYEGKDGLLINSKTINISEKIFYPSIVALLVDVFGLFVIYLFFQNIDSGCGDSCLSLGFFLVTTLYYISIAVSLKYITKKPIIVGIYLIAASFASLMHNMIFGILSFIIFFYCGGKLMEQAWKEVEKKDRMKQLLIGLLLFIFAILLGLIRVMQLAQ